MRCQKHTLNVNRTLRHVSVTVVSQNCSGLESDVGAGESIGMAVILGRRGVWMLDGWSYASHGPGLRDSLIQKVITARTNALARVVDGLQAIIAQLRVSSPCPGTVFSFHSASTTNRDHVHRAAIVISPSGAGGSTSRLVFDSSEQVDYDWFDEAIE